MTMKKILSAAVAGVICAGMFTGCASESGASAAVTEQKSDFNTKHQ